MARGKFNKRGGGPRLDAISAEEIEQRNARLAELEEERAQRRADEEEEGGEEEAKEEKAEEQTDKKKADKKGDTPPVPVTTEADHKRNLRKLAEVRKRREEAEKKRLQEEELAKQQEAEAKKLADMNLGDDSEDEKEDIPKLDKIAIKKMKPAQMKEALKVRGLDIQGNAKTLQDRLLKYESER